jgi:hypothetical protein
MTDDFAGFAAFGTTVSIDTTPVWGVQDISGPALSTDTAETTNHSSPGSTEQRVATVKRTGEISFPMVLRSSDAGQQALYEAWQDRDAHDFVITKPSGVVHTFEGLVTAFGDSAGVTAAETLDVTITPIAWPDDATTFPGS